MANVLDIKGIGSADARRLLGVDIDSTQELLDRGATREGRKELCVVTGVPEAQILAWVNQADLMRVDGVGVEYAELLARAGVTTLDQLAHANAHDVHERMLVVNATQGLTASTPTVAVVQHWIDQARTLPHIVEE